MTEEFHSHPLSSRRRRALIVERKLVRNRGHHHTQIAAIRELLSGHEIMLLTGADYDGFLPYPSRSIMASVGKDGRRARRDAFGPLHRRLAATFLRALPGLHLRHSRFGIEFFEAISSFGLESQDAIVIPSATLDDLSAVAEAYARLDSRTHPRCYVRFLDPYLGEPSARLREAQMADLLRVLPQAIHLYCETDEMADYMSDRFHHHFTGGFYLPCTLDPRKKWDKPQRNPDDPFRVGVFGIPRKEKGAMRIGAIVDAVGGLRQAESIEFIVQGRESDFQSNGLYATVATKDNHVHIRRLVGALGPEEFRQNFLSSNVILLPYDVSLYNLQGSGLVQDAVAANIPIVYSRGMSMRRLLDRGNALAATSDDEFAEAIITLAANNQTFMEGCRAANRIFREILADHPVRRL